MRRTTSSRATDCAGLAAPTSLATAWPTRITRWEPDSCFVDEQLRCPYRLWVHSHRFEPSGAGTIMRDTVRWALPLQPVGEIAARLVQCQLDCISRYRERALRRDLLGA